MKKTRKLKNYNPKKINILKLKKYLKQNGRQENKSINGKRK